VEQHEARQTERAPEVTSLEQPHQLWIEAPRADDDVHQAILHQSLDVR
jgi:hypothetical protein